MVGGNHYDVAGLTPRIWSLRNGLDPDGANIVKYIARCRAKGRYNEDIQKAIHVAKLREHWLAGTNVQRYLFTSNVPMDAFILANPSLERDQTDALLLAEAFFKIDGSAWRGAKWLSLRGHRTSVLVSHLFGMLKDESE